MKQLIVINGTMGVGKSATCRALLKQLTNAVWLDGDWCWMMNPWKITEENKRMVEGNIVHLLNAYLQNTEFDYIIFSWVLHHESILPSLLARVDNHPYELHQITLTCVEDALRRRMLQDHREEAAIQSAISRLPLYEKMSTRKIDTSDLGIDETIKKILSMIGL